MPGVSLDVATMKVPDLKKELKARGLSVEGKKDELLERLQEALAGEELGVVLDEEKFLDEELEVDEDTEKALLEGTTPPVAKKAKIIKLDETATAEKPAATDEGKTPQEKRAERFGMPMTAEAKKVARAARFGIVDPAEKKAARAARFGITGTAPDINVNKKATSADIGKLKARAARFGEISSNTLKKVSLLEKKKERAERFKSSIVTVSEAKDKSEEIVTSTDKTPKVPITMDDSE